MPLKYILSLIIATFFITRRPYYIPLARHGQAAHFRYHLRTPVSGWLSKLGVIDSGQCLNQTFHPPAHANQFGQAGDTRLVHIERTLDFNL